MYWKLAIFYLLLPIPLGFAQIKKNIELLNLLTQLRSDRSNFETLLDTDLTATLRSEAPEPEQALINFIAAVRVFEKPDERVHDAGDHELQRLRHNDEPHLLKVAQA